MRIGIKKPGFKAMSEKVGRAYLRNIKRWMPCPSCRSGKPHANKKKGLWICDRCGYELPIKEFENNYIFWFCDECDAYLNIQDGFDRSAPKHKCTKCDFVNDITTDNTKGTCADCGKTLVDNSQTFCTNCKLERRKKWVERLKTAGLIVGAVAAAAVAVAASNDEKPKGSKNFDSSGDDEGPDYPICDSCGSRMTEFDGCWWYTCPECGNGLKDTGDDDPPPMGERRLRQWLWAIYGLRKS